jgi:acetylornithine deacetylase/succinyl-diaminopimelate desuccinylase-like protein
VSEPTAALRAEWAKLDFDPRAFLGAVGLSAPAGETGYSVMEQMFLRPTLEFNGITGGYQGAGTKTVIPARASVKITCRLVPGQTPRKVTQAVRAFVESRLPPDCRATFTGEAWGDPLVIDETSSRVAKCRAALADEWGRPAVIRAMGGSIPIVADFKSKLGMDSLMVGFGVPDDRGHSPNEKYNLTSFHKGARSWARILAALAT